MFTGTNKFPVKNLLNDNKNKTEDPKLSTSFPQMFDETIGITHGVEDVNPTSLLWDSECFAATALTHILPCVACHSSLLYTLQEIIPEQVNNLESSQNIYNVLKYNYNKPNKR